MEYIRTKTNVNVETLSLEIKESTVITTDLTSITFTEPDSLKVVFVLELSGVEETELDSIISAHTGQALNHYRLLCNTCLDYKSIREKSTPSKCPACEGVDITDIVEQIPYTSMKDELGNSWEAFLASNGNIINARRY